MRPLVSSFESTACSRVGEPLGRYFQPATGPFAREYIVHHPAELIGDEISDHGCAKSRRLGRSYRWPSALLPLEHQFATRAAVRLPSPANCHPAMAIGQCTVLGGVGDQFVQ